MQHISKLEGKLQKLYVKDQQNQSTIDLMDMMLKEY